MTPELSIDLNFIDHVAFGSGPIIIPDTLTWDQLSARAGRNDMPGILAVAILKNQLSRKELAKGIAETWIMAEWPVQAMDTNVWAYVFTQVCDEGYFLTDDGEVKSHDELPEVMTLYRGCLPEFKEGMSWTTNKEEAIWFAHRLDHHENIGHLYTITVPCDIVFAKFDGRGEGEIVIEVSQLGEDDIEEMEES